MGKERGTLSLLGALALLLLLPFQLLARRLEFKPRPSRSSVGAGKDALFGFADSQQFPLSAIQRQKHPFASPEDRRLADELVLLVNSYWSRASSARTRRTWWSNTGRLLSSTLDKRVTGAHCPTKAFSHGDSALHRTG